MTPRRVVIWGPGNVGAPAIRSVARHPELELTGVIVHSPEKEGRDAGELAGIEPLGIAASRDAQAVLATQPDALVYAVNSDFRPIESQKECCEALRAGISVVTAGMYGLLHPPSAPEDLARAFESACAEGDSSFLASGIDPGLAIDLLPMILSGCVQEIREIRIVENFNYAYYDQPDAVRNLVGLGGSMDATPPMLLPFALESVWGGALRGLAGSLGAKVEEIRTTVEKHPLERTVENAMGRFDAGSLGAFRFEVQAIIAGQPKLVLEHITRIDDETAPQWPRPAKQGYHQVRLSGHPDMVVTVECEDEAGNHAGGGNSAAAARITNAIPFVCDAPAGLLSAAELPLITGRGRLL